MPHLTRTHTHDHNLIVFMQDFLPKDMVMYHKSIKTILGQKHITSSSDDQPLMLQKNRILYKILHILHRANIDKIISHHIKVKAIVVAERCIFIDLYHEQGQLQELKFFTV